MHSSAIMVQRETFAPGVKRKKTMCFVIFEGDSDLEMIPNLLTPK